MLYPKVITLAVSKLNGRSSYSHRIFFEPSDLVELNLNSSLGLEDSVIDF